LKLAQIGPKQALKYPILVNIRKRPKNGQMAKPLYFWQTVSKEAKLGRFGLKKAKWQPWQGKSHSSFLISFGKKKFSTVCISNC